MASAGERPAKRAKGSLVRAGYNNDELSEMYDARADKASTTQKDLDREFGDPDAFSEQRDGARPYNNHMAIVYRDGAHRGYQLMKPSLPTLVKNQGTGAKLVLGQIIEAACRVSRTANTTARFDNPHEDRVNTPDEGDTVFLELTDRGRESEVLQNMQLLVTEVRGDPLRSSCVVVCKILSFQ